MLMPAELVAETHCCYCLLLIGTSTMRTSLEVTKIVYLLFSPLRASSCRSAPTEAIQDSCSSDAVLHTTFAASVDLDWMLVSFIEFEILTAFLALNCIASVRLLGRRSSSESDRCIASVRFLARVFFLRPASDLLLWMS